MNKDSLDRFIMAQELQYAVAFSEIRQCRKQSHWMWYIFPQIQGLGQSEYSRRYAIGNLAEAKDFLSHSLLGKRLVDISNELLKCSGDDAFYIFGQMDEMKLQSSMTLFSMVHNADPVFDKVLHRFFNGQRDNKTLNILAKEG